MESVGPIETGVTRSSGRGVVFERKASLMVQELQKYQLSVTGISETKWFGQSVYEVDGYTILHSGRQVPDEGPLQRGESVGIVLDPALTDALRESGEEWKVVSPRVVKVRLKLCNDLANQRNLSTYMTVISAYAPYLQITSRREGELLH